MNPTRLQLNYVSSLTGLVDPSIMKDLFIAVIVLMLCMIVCLFFFRDKLVALLAVGGIGVRSRLDQLISVYINAILV